MAVAGVRSLKLSKEYFEEWFAGEAATPDDDAAPPVDDAAPPDDDRGAIESAPPDDGRGAFEAAPPADDRGAASQQSAPPADDRAAAASKRREFRVPHLDTFAALKPKKKPRGDGKLARVAERPRKTKKKKRRQVAEAPQPPRAPDSALSLTTSAVLRTVRSRGAHDTGLSQTADSAVPRTTRTRAAPDSALSQTADSAALGTTRTRAAHELEAAGAGAAAARAASLAFSAAADPRRIWEKMTRSSHAKDVHGDAYEGPLRQSASAPTASFHADGDGRTRSGAEANFARRNVWYAVQARPRRETQAPHSTALPSGRTPVIGLGGVGGAAGERPRYAHTVRLAQVSDDDSVGSSRPRVLESWRRPWEPAAARRLPSYLMFQRDAGVAVVRGAVGGPQGQAGGYVIRSIVPID
ncbi:hypothetical protein M885DRAFT_529180 [Pelagophyceae sp. CCMP2097]|nr:hypothetical protein M885DRAFT_529180 [Pelagophyceae sp. CCMP2097]